MTLNSAYIPNTCASDSAAQCSQASLEQNEGVPRNEMVDDACEELSCTANYEATKEDDNEDQNSSVHSHENDASKCQHEGEYEVQVQCYEQASGPYERVDDYEQQRVNGPYERVQNYEQFQAGGPYDRVQDYEQQQVNGPYERVQTYEQFQAGGLYERVQNYEHFHASGP